MKLLGLLYRARWWVTAALTAVAVFVLDTDERNPWTWVPFTLLVVLVLIPVAFRWGTAARKARTTFSDGLHGR